MVEMGYNILLSKPEAINPNSYLNHRTTASYHIKYTTFVSWLMQGISVHSRCCCWKTFV